MKSHVKVAFAFLALALAGCNDNQVVGDTSATPTAPPVTPTPTPEPTPPPVSSVNEQYRQTYADRKVDVLWVIDSSGSMDAEQAALSAAFGDFIQGFTALDLDFHLGVTNTDISNGTGAMNGKLMGSPTYLTAQTPDLISTFQLRVNVPTTNGNETGLDAAKLALSEPLLSTDNVGFLRDDAVLSVLFLSDEDNYGTSSPSVTWDNHAQWFADLKPDITKLYVTAIVGPMTGSCSGPTGSGLGASEASEYHNFITALNGTVADICSGNFQVTLQDLSSIIAALATTFPLEYQPIPGTIQVTVAGQVVPGGPSTWNYNAVSNEIVFAPDAIPPECEDIDIDYALAPGQGVTEPIFEHPVDADCTP